MKKRVTQMIVLAVVLMIGLKAQSPGLMMDKAYFLAHKDEIKEDLFSRKIDKTFLCAGKIGGYALTGVGVFMMASSIELASNITNEHVFFYFMDWGIRTLVFATGVGSVLVGLGTVSLCNEGLVRTNYHIESLKIILKEIEPDARLYNNMSFKFSFPIHSN
jgi:hypothetical protein